MESRKCPPHPKDGGVKKKLDKLAEDIKKLPQDRKDLLKKSIERKAYSTREAADMLGIAYTTLRRLMMSGEIKYIKITSRCIRISADEIERFRNFVTMKKAAKMMGIADLTVRKLVDAGRLKAFRIGRPWRISIADIEKFMKGDFLAEIEALKQEPKE